MTYTADEYTKPAFIPLTRKWFEAFERGEKTVEYRPNIPRWHHRHFYLGRAVTLSLGYGKQRRITGIVTGWRIVGPEANPAIREVYLTGDEFVAISIQLAAAPRRG